MRAQSMGLLHLTAGALLLAALTQGCNEDEPGTSSGDQSEVVGQGGGTAATSVGAGGIYNPPGPVGSCSELCTSLGASCSGNSAQFGSSAVCEAVCATYPEGMSDDMHGNTRGCRLSYAAMAAQDGAHCLHAGPVGTSPTAQIGETTYCGGACENFCALAAQVCGGTYGSQTDCLLECASFDFGEPYSPTATSGFACRMAELTEAALAPARCANIVAGSPACN